MIAHVETIRFDFRSPAKTSRGTYTFKEHQFLIVQLPDTLHVGEIAPMPQLSIESQEEVNTELNDVLRFMEREQKLPSSRDYSSSVRFAIESIQRSMRNADHSFRIPINGLVWMNDTEQMWADTLLKVEQGFSTIKYKVGANDLHEELDLLRRVRDQFPSLTIRLDANGAFASRDCLMILEKYAAFGIHSIEQPIAPGHRRELAELVQRSPIPIALDEELIGVESMADMVSLLEEVRPHYVVLKPMLHGGFEHCDQWIRLATNLGVRWWATSYLESNIGLRALGHWLSEYQPTIPQGLGTGGIYRTNIDGPLNVEHGELVYDALGKWNAPWK